MLRLSYCYREQTRSSVEKSGNLHPRVFSVIGFDFVGNLLVCFMARNKITAGFLGFFCGAYSLRVVCMKVYSATQLMTYNSFCFQLPGSSFCLKSDVFYQSTARICISTFTKVEHKIFVQMYFTSGSKSTRWFFFCRCGFTNKKI